MEYDISILKGICHTTNSESERIAYSIDSSRIKGNALAITWPENAEQLQKIMRNATRERVPLTPRGGGTSLVGGAVPQNSVVVDMSRFNKIKKIDIRDKIAIVEAGVILDDLDDVLKKYNLEFPIKPGSHAACTIGGMIATNAGGMMTKRFGKVADWVEVIRIMDGTGKVFNLEGNDIKEFSGTEGCCAIVLEAKLKLNELAENHSTDFFEFNDIPSMIDKLNEVKNDNDAVAVEYISSLAAKAAGLKEKEYLLVKYEGTKGSIDVARSENIWKMRENIYSILVDAGYSKIEDPLIENNIDTFIDWLKKQEMPCFGHIAFGVLHPHFKTEEDREKINDAVKEINGKPCGEHGVGILKRRTAPFAFVQKIKMLKEKYDPYGILNKGKVL